MVTAVELVLPDKFQPRYITRFESAVLDELFSSE